jgi:hypothetical protein
MPRSDARLQDHLLFGPSCMRKRGGAAAILCHEYGDDRPHASPGCAEACRMRCPKTEQKLNHIASLGSFGMPERRILESLRGTPYPM